MITREDLDRERRRSLSRLARVRQEWEKRHAGSVPFDPREGDGSDYALHHMDISATPEQEEEFQRLADEAMAPFRELAEAYAKQQEAK